MFRNKIDGNIGKNVNIYEGSNIYKWSSNRRMVLAVLCAVVGLTNCWKFPQAYKNWGGCAFMVPTLLVTVFVAIPLTFMELAIGQFSNRAALDTWKMCPLWKGAGWACMTVLCTLTIGNNVVCSCLLFYAVMSLGRNLPWSECQASWGALENCYTFETYMAVRKTCAAKHGDQYCSKLHWQNSVQHYWYIKVLNYNNDNVYHLKYELVICGAVSLFLIFLCLREGTRSLENKLVFFFTVPYAELAILVFVSLIHPGSLRGVQVFIKADFSKLKQHGAWQAAVENALISIYLGVGNMMTIGMLNDFRSGSHMLAIVANLVNLTSSIVYTLLSSTASGTLSYSLNIPMEVDAHWKGNLVFVREPLAFLYWPGYKQLWSFLFFSSVYISALRIQVMLVLTTLANMYSLYPKLQRFPTLVTATMCAVLFLLGLPHFTPIGGRVLLFLEQVQCSCMMIFITCLEVMGIMWVYGINNVINDIQFMLGFKVSLYWQMSWFFLPLAMFVFLLISIYDLTKMNVLSNEYTNMLLTIQYGALISLMLVPFLYIMWYLWRMRENKFGANLLKQHADWGPRDPILRKSREMFTAHSMTKEYMYRQNRLNSKKYQATAEHCNEIRMMECDAEVTETI